MPHQIIWSWYIGRWWVSCYIRYSEEGPGRAWATPSPILAVPNVTAHSITASVPITVLLYNGMLLCSFNVTVKGLHFRTYSRFSGISRHQPRTRWRRKTDRWIDADKRVANEPHKDDISTWRWEAWLPRRSTSRSGGVLFSVVCVYSFLCCDHCL